MIAFAFLTLSAMLAIGSLMLGSYKSSASGPVIALLGGSIAVVAELVSVVRYHYGVGFWFAAFTASVVHAAIGIYASRRGTISVTHADLAPVLVK